MATYYVRVTFYDESPDVEEYGSIEEAIESFQDAIDNRREIGDISSISYGRYLPDGKMKRLGFKEYD